MHQLALPLAYRQAAGVADFFVSPANADAVAWLDRWPDWPQPQALLIGPAKSGKSHLARLFAGRTGATVFDDADQHAVSAVASIKAKPGTSASSLTPEALFHAWNAATLARPLLLTARTPRRAWPATLPDLASRLAATPTLVIADPDDALLAAVLAKQFADRGLRVAPEVAAYLLSRIDRSFAAGAAIVAKLDAAALTAGRAVTLPLTRAVLEAQGDWLAGAG